MKIKILLNYKKWWVCFYHKNFHQTFLAVAFLVGTLIATYFYYLQPLGMGKKIYWVWGDHAIWLKEKPDASLFSHYLAIQDGIQFFLKKDESHLQTTCFFIDAYGLFQKILGNHCIFTAANWIVRLENGFLSLYSFQDASDKTEQCLQRLENLYSFLKSQKIPFLYIQIPRKIHREAPFLPLRLVDYHNLVANEFLQGLQKKNIPYIDIRELYRYEPERHYELFYRGDHHWTPEYALITFQQIIPWLNSHASFAIPPEIADFRNFQRKILISDWRGTQKERTGKYFLPFTEDRFCYLPLGATDLELLVPETKRGCLQDVLLIHDYNYPLQRAINHKVPEKKILLIKDSFSLPLFDYLILGCHELIMVDLRRFDGNCKEFIQNEKPDVVLVAYNPSLIKPHTFGFELSLEQRKMEME